MAATWELSILPHRKSDGEALFQIDMASDNIVRSDRVCLSCTLFVCVTFCIMLLAAVLRLLGSPAALQQQSTETLVFAAVSECHFMAELFQDCQKCWRCFSAAAIDLPEVSWSTCFTAQSSPPSPPLLIQVCPPPPSFFVLLSIHTTASLCSFLAVILRKQQ